MATIDHDFVEYIIKSLVSQPDQVKIERTIDEKGVLLTLSVADDDLGRVIGKRGATAQSLRTLLRALGTKNEARYNLKIADGGTQPPRPRREQEPRQDETVSDQPAPAVNKDLQSDFASDSSDEQQPAESSSADEPAEDSLAQTKKELADLDDLDI